MTDRMDPVIYLLRHAEAGKRDVWTRPDRERPLTPMGRRQSVALAERMAGTSVMQLVSSPYVRCLQTLDPLAASRDLGIRARDELAEGQPLGLAEKVVLDTAAEGSAIICVHSDGMTGLIRSLDARGLPLAGRPSDHAKASIWMLRIVRGLIVSATYEPPPTV